MIRRDGVFFFSFGFSVYEFGYLPWVQCTADQTDSGIKFVFSLHFGSGWDFSAISYGCYISLTIFMFSLFIFIFPFHIFRLLFRFSFEKPK